MTFEKLEKIIDKNRIPKNVKLMSDSGWECCETEMNGIHYNKKENILIFTQGNGTDFVYRDNKDYECLYTQFKGYKGEYYGK